jgi:hypothetical protein
MHSKPQRRPAERRIRGSWFSTSWSARFAHGSTPGKPRRDDDPAWPEDKHSFHCVENRQNIFPLCGKKRPFFPHRGKSEPLKPSAPKFPSRCPPNPAPRTRSTPDCPTRLFAYTLTLPSRGMV